MKRQQKKRRRIPGRTAASKENTSAAAHKPKSRPAAQDRPRPDQDLLLRLDVAGKALERIEAGEAPSAAELAEAPRLDFWCIAEDGLFPILQGVVTGHPLLQDGAYVGTSPLLWISPDETAARTLSRFYRLGPSLLERLNQCN